ncbi:predicted protein [Uncinocarpus reesii 1704]|uniref:GED domain-containing protein n=1 Tax=Uncinocarpus reesii (strain UAMH 1704) TaxID=336963 RepID=C4JTK7_UNCRE|nr:uncharacterized protein UREG_05796 [Uncinocarpus reesii 1704]EEP80954.1 predicted protein [Uncinocarpus reesii 1704]
MVGSYSKLGDPALLDKIDRLFSCNVGEYIDLPQLVVVGDQSSGKSSVLEGLTKLPFPRDSGLCTRFATQIVFRRARAKSIGVSIIPHANSTIEHAERVKEWKTALEVLDSDSFGRVMKEVHDVMNLSDKQNGANGAQRTFSRDVLRLEIAGPDEDHLSIIDVPGIFKSTTEGLTTKEDIVLVRDMVYGYMQNPRSIMLMVVPANVDIATQEIVEMAKELDPEAQRTLGVLTKPDLVDKGAEGAVVRMVNGKEQGSGVQWSVVRNPGQQDLQNQNTSRQGESKFFSEESPWNSMPADRTGIDALRDRLQEVHTAHTRREFPKVKIELTKRLQVQRKTLEALGDDRTSPEKQTRFLIDIATKYQALVSQALSSDYGSETIFYQHDELRVATAVMQRADTFSDHMENWGHRFYFAPKSLGETCEPEDSDFGLLSPPPDDLTSQGTKLARKSHTLNVRTKETPADLDDILYSPEDVSKPLGGISDWLKTTYQESRGFELGTFGSSLLPTLVHKQSENWKDLALGFVSDTIAMVHCFLVKLLKHLCPNERVASGLLSALSDDLGRRYRRSLKHVSFLLDVETKENPLTLNHYFNDSLQKCRQERMHAVLSEKSFADCRHGEVVRLGDIVQHHPMGNANHTLQDIHDILKSYYKVARKRFVDNVWTQAVNHFLVAGPDTPLKLLTAAYILNLTQEQLESIAAEDPRTKRQREQLRKEVDDLDRGRKILF